MYIPRRFEEKDTEKIREFVRENSFAILVTVKDGLPIGSHIPLVLEKDEQGRDVLMGHISRGNEQKFTLADGVRVLAVFPGPHAYISPRWYTELRVPTWNYIAVHVYGTIRIVEGEELRAALSRLMDTYEHGMPHPVTMSELPEKSVSDDLRGIVGFALLVEEWQAAYKLSQNRDPQSYAQVAVELEKGDEQARGVAEEMKKRAGDGL